VSESDMKVERKIKEKNLTKAWNFWHGESNFQSWKTHTYKGKGQY